jgi:hypothetical protein
MLLRDKKAFSSKHYCCTTKFFFLETMSENVLMYYGCYGYGLLLFTDFTDSVDFLHIRLLLYFNKNVI